MFPARIWREKKQRYRLEGKKCQKCGWIAFPPRLICPECKGREWEDIQLSWKGKIVSFTVIHTPPTPFSDEAPYALAIVEVPEGVRLTCQVVDCDLDSLKVGDQVQLEFRRIQKAGESGVLCYGYKAVPAW